MNFWNNFAAKHPAAAKWVREGGLFVIVSNLITVFKYLLLQFLPKAFASLPVVDFGWPGIDITLFGETFKWNILGYDAAHGGLPYFCAYMVAMIVGECINFPIQRSFVFRSKGNLAKQIGWYVLAFCVITCIVNSINCIWVAVAGTENSRPPSSFSFLHKDKTPGAAQEPGVLLCRAVPPRRRSASGAGNGGRFVVVLRVFCAPDADFLPIGPKFSKNLAL